MFLFYGMFTNLKFRYFKPLHSNFSEKSIKEDVYIRQSISNKYTDGCDSQKIHNFAIEGREKGSKFTSKTV